MKSVSVFLIVLTVTTSHCNDNDNDCCFWRQEKLDTESGSVKLNWMVDSIKQTITFEVISNSTVVSFGFTHDKDLSHPFDFVLGGIDENGNEMLLDMTAHYHKDNNIEIVNDAEQDYHLLEIERIGPVMKIKFHRKWDTGDSNDLQFDTSLVHLIWFNGIMEGMTFLPNENKNTVNIFKIYMLEPRVGHPDKNTESWQFIQRGVILPNKSTTYWCTLHKVPRLLKDKHHVIGFRALLNTELERKHTHHIVLYKCDATLDSIVITSNGKKCYESLEQESLPIQKCRTFMYVWAYGGEDFYLPNDVGYPIGEKEIEYYLLEVHYDNPELLSGLAVEAGIEIILTKEIRKNDAGLFMIGYDIAPSLILPPHKEDIAIMGHCKASCTNNLLPSDGLHVFGAFLHSHKLGRKMKLFRRDTKELNEIARDDFYDYSFQQSRLLSERKRIGPGDILTMECHYSSRQKNTTTVGGFSSRDEMCLGFLWYYPKIQNLKACLSAISLPDADVWNKTAHLYETYESHVGLC